MVLIAVAKCSISVKNKPLLESKEKFSYTLHTIQLKLKVKDNLNSIELIKKILPPQVSLKFTTY